MAFSSVALAEWFETSEAIMGTSVQAEIWHTDALRAEALLAQVMTVMWGVDTAFSPFKPDSELSVLNRRAGVGWVAVSAELLDLLARSRQMSEMAHGAFDITYASVGRYYDYRDGVKPSDEKIRSALEAINYRYVELDMAGSRGRFQHPDVYVDLGGIAKGYAVDVAIDLLKKAGVDQASVSAGGDSRILGDRRGQPWTVGVKHPRKPDAMVAILPLEETAVSTSGDYERFFERDGVRYHHILDPTTGDSARRSMSVTILGPQATFTDALSTSVFVLGPEKGLELVNQLPGIDAIIIDEDGNMRFSEDLQELATP
ncbi:MAG: FAD:protein FMN transferase [Proteobacteria bacterium]|nr:FAD:protein FMN transferase [Pseudomonadota bacterium]